MPGYCSGEEEEVTFGPKKLTSGMLFNLNFLLTFKFNWTKIAKPQAKY